MKYYVISYQNVKTGEIKEYYKCLSTIGDKAIKDFAIKLAKESNLDTKFVRIHIYELKTIIYNDEY